LSKLQILPGPGSIVEYLQDNQVNLAIVLEEQGGRVRLFTQRGRELTIPGARLLPWHGPRHPYPAPRSELEQHLARHLAQRERVAAEIDVMDIWNLAQGEMDAAALEWFAELIWDQADADQLAGLARVLLEAKTHFKYQPPLFVIHPEETVQARMREQEAAREHQELVLAGQDFFLRLWKTGQPSPEPTPESAQKLAQLILHQLHHPDDLTSDNLWRNLTKRLPEHPHQALVLAQAWGLVPAHYNFHLAQAGYDWQDDWSAGHIQEIRQIQDAVHAQEKPAALTGLISVDAESTRDIDDAFALEQTPDGYHLTLALACPALTWPWGSDLDEAVAQRASSLYLPEGVSHMLPESLGADLFSLRQNQPRPALVLDLWLDAQAEVQACEPRLEWVRLDCNAQYIQVEEHIQNNQPPFSQAHTLADLLRNRRISQGAVVFDQPDPEIALHQNQDQLRVTVENKTLTPKAQLLVSEFMVLANTELANWALRTNVPVLYRTQNVALPEGAGGQYTRAEDMYRMSRMLANAAVQTKPARHASLGATAYASVTSPLRRYVDLLNLGQVVSMLRHGSPRLNRDELQAGLPFWRARMEAVGRVQRSRTRYWKLEYLRQQGTKTFWPAILVDETPSQAVFSMPDIQVLIRTPKRLLGDKGMVGARYQVRLGRVDPLLNEIKAVEVCDEETIEKE